MKVVNLGDPYTKRLTLRLTDIQYKHVVRMAEDLYTTPSDYIRFLIMQSAVLYDREMILETGGTSIENVETDNDNFI